MLTQKEALESVVYQPDTGFFLSRFGSTRRGKGERIGFQIDRGYRVCWVNAKPIYEHRLAWLCFFGYLPPKGKEIDHINGDRADNRIENLREISKRENQCNRTTHRAGRLPGARAIKGGIKSKWRAAHYVDGKRRHLGCFATEREAHIAYCAATGINPSI
jgi:HNH endonuclease